MLHCDGINMKRDLPFNQLSSYVDGDDDDDDIEERKGMFVTSVLKSIYTIIVRLKTSLYISS